MSDFEWDATKDRVNQAKHEVGFELAQHAFLDPSRVIAEDIDHSGNERRYFCFGQVEGAVTDGTLHMAKRTNQGFRAGYWRKGKAMGEEANG